MRGRHYRPTEQRASLIRMALRTHRSVLLLSLLGTPLGLLACARGGGGGPSGASLPGVHLTAIEFPDGDRVAAEPPEEASLVQQVVFRFTGPVDGDSVHSRSLQIKDPSQALVAGSYRVQGSSVVFTPTLPVRPIDTTQAPLLDLGGAALVPGATYFIEVVAGQADSVSNLVGFSPDLLARIAHPALSRAVLTSFSTTTDETRFLSGLRPRRLQLVSVHPEDGATTQAPNLYSDPLDLFPVNLPIRLVFDGPLHPDPGSVGDDRFRLIDLDDTGVVATGLPLGVDVFLRENLPDRSVVEMQPTGILPLGHLLAVEIPWRLRHLSEPPVVNQQRQVVAIYPLPSASLAWIPDAYVEEFVNEDGFGEGSTSVQRGMASAEWNRNGSGFLQAAAFPGSGELGDFRPSTVPGPDPAVIILDTDHQPLPLLDGSTPAAPAGTVVEGGVFHFHDIDIPAGVTIQPLGSHPLVLTATGSVRVAGTILLAGLDGQNDHTRDSAIYPVGGGKGGAGGGKGGESHPAYYFPPASLGLLHLIPPPKGEDGRGPRVDGLFTLGGQGGTSAVVDDPTVPNPEILCGEDPFGDPSRGSHGGGGSFLTRGKSGRPGAGNIRATADHRYIDAGDTVAPPGLAGPSVFTGRVDDNFIGTYGQIKVVRGGQGGGGGGSKLESYYCGYRMPWGLDEFRGLWPDTTADSKGGGGGGGGGAIEILALGSITLDSTALIDADGGTGGGGESVGTSSFGGGGGGGSGGAVILRSGSDVQVHPQARILLRGGDGDNHHRRNSGTGGDGLAQIEVPMGRVPTVGAGAVIPASSYLDPTNTVNPVDYGPLSRAVSRWIDLGRSIARPSGGARFRFTGTDPATGQVLTDALGFLPDPASLPFEIDYLGRLNPATREYFTGEEPREDWIPPGATVVIEFRAADAMAPGSKEVNPDSLGDWTPDWNQIAGRQFVRWRVTFNVSADGQPIGPKTRRPVMHRLQLDFDF